ncbi:MAG: class I SAM-dependent methyltransferase [Candidatus Aenigmatarchaeota archaeon]
MIKKIISELLKNYYQRIFLKKAIEEIKKYKFEKLKDLIDFVYKFRVGPKNKYLSLNIVPAQIREEIEKLLNILSKKKPKTILEIGTANGGTLFLWCRIAHKTGKIISIDLPGGKFGGGYPKWKFPLYKSFATGKQKVYLIRDDSHNKQSFKKIIRILNGEKLDFLFIDGDHTYEGVRKDFEMYSPLVKKGGIIAFHDIVPGPEEYVGGVPKFWKEIKKKYKHKEIVKNWKQRYCGIGIIYT